MPALERRNSLFHSLLGDSFCPACCSVLRNFFLLCRFWWSSYHWNRQTSCWGFSADSQGQLLVRRGLVNSDLARPFDSFTETVFPCCLCYRSLAPCFLHQCFSRLCCPQCLQLSIASQLDPNQRLLYSEAFAWVDAWLVVSHHQFVEPQQVLELFLFFLCICLREVLQLEFSSSSLFEICFGGV